MRFMILVKASEASEAGVMPEESMIAEMAAYHEELAKAGVLLDASGLHPTSRAWRVRYEGDRRAVIDGPFAESKELVAGYTTIQVRSREEAEEWVRRFPNPGGPGGTAEIEVRQLVDLADLGEGEAVGRFRELGLPSQA